MILFVALFPRRWRHRGYSPLLSAASYFWLIPSRPQTRGQHMSVLTWGEGEAEDGTLLTVDDVWTCIKHLYCTNTMPHNSCFVLRMEYPSLIILFFYVYKCDSEIVFLLPSHVLSDRTPMLVTCWLSNFDINAVAWFQGAYLRLIILLFSYWLWCIMWRVYFFLVNLVKRWSRDSQRTGLYSMSGHLQGIDGATLTEGIETKLAAGPCYTNDLTK